jgi:hypothetical protein
VLSLISHFCAENKANDGRFGPWSGGVLAEDAWHLDF